MASAAVAAADASAGLGSAHCETNSATEPVPATTLISNRLEAVLRDEHGVLELDEPVLRIRDLALE